MSFNKTAPHALRLRRSNVGDSDVLCIPFLMAVKYIIPLETYIGGLRGNNPDRPNTELRLVETLLGSNLIIGRYLANIGCYINRGS
jgi:hypothetical protein